MKTFEGNEVHTICTPQGVAGVTVYRRWFGSYVVHVCEDHGWLGSEDTNSQAFQTNASLLEHEIIEGTAPDISGVALAASFIYQRTPCLQVEDTDEAAYVITQIMDVLENEAVTTCYTPAYRYVNPLLRFGMESVPEDNGIEELSEEIAKKAEEDNDIPF